MASAASPRIALPPLLPALPVIAGLVAMYLPTFIDVARIYWANERGTAGPLILAICGWLGWRVRGRLLALPASGARPLAGSAVLGVGLACYALGRSQEFAQFEVGSLILVLAGLVLGTRGPAGLKATWFPLLHLIFVVPLPGSLLDSILVPLKQQVSIAAEAVMYALGFPVARTGVVLSIGQYQLLIADACSGLSSMIALTGVGLVYVHVAGHASLVRNAILVAAVLPIAFASNLARVCLLMWVTWQFGDAAGQRFHDLAGYSEIALAFALFFGLDSALHGAARLSGRAPAGLRTGVLR